MSGKKTFSVNVVALKAFSFMMDSFDYAVTFLFNIKQKVKISFVSSASIKAVSNIILKKIKLNISMPRLIGRQVQGITVKKIKLSVTIKEIGKLIFPITLKKIKIGFTARDRQRTTSAIGLKKIKFGFTGSYGTQPQLGTFDPQTLGTLDTNTLGDMDFISL